MSAIEKRFGEGKGPEAVRGMIRAALANAEREHLLHRLHCVLLVAAGRSRSEVAEWFEVDRRTIQRWVHAAYVLGIEGLIDHHNGGRPATMTCQQLEWIRVDLQASPRASGYPDRAWTGKRLALHLAKCYDLNMSVRSCQRLIARSRAGHDLPDMIAQARKV